MSAVGTFCLQTFGHLVKPMTFGPVTFGQVWISVRSDLVKSQTDRKWCIRAHRAYAQVGSKISLRISSVPTKIINSCPVIIFGNVWWQPPGSSDKKSNTRKKGQMSLLFRQTSWYLFATFASENDQQRKSYYFQGTWRSNIWQGGKGTNMFVTHKELWSKFLV